jgi:RimJ/RimL family protein N-acetyltransferase
MFALTSRLVLRPGWPEDAPVLARAIGHAAVVRNLARAPWPYGPDDAAAFLALPRGAHDPNFLILERGGAHRLVGGAALIRDDRGAWEIGYWLTPDAWGRGYATEAGQAVLRIARDTLRARRVIGRHFVDNPASGRVLRKLGFVETGRSSLHSVARGHAAPCIDMVAQLVADDTPELDRPLTPAMPIAA